jgi:hypothetical protein
MAEHAACTGAECIGKSEEERPLRRPRLDGRLILKQISGR